MSTRVTRLSIEQKLVEFELPKPASDQTYVSIPDDAKLTQHSRAFEIFGVDHHDDTMTWSAFRNDVRSRYASGGSSIIFAIEQAIISAVSPTFRLDNDQLIRSSNDQVFRVLVARQCDYYNGRKIVYVYFIPKLQHRTLGDNDTSIILGLINVAAKYRFIFVESDSPLSVESFMLERDPAKIQNKVLLLLRELNLIEEESRNLKLDQVPAISAYLGRDRDDLDNAIALKDTWFEARCKLITAAEKILGVLPASAEFRAANQEWLEVLKSFRLTSDQINSTVTIQALDNLKKSFTASRRAMADGKRRAMRRRSTSDPVTLSAQHQPPDTHSG